MLLADLGAEIIKIEPPWGEALRSNPPLVTGLSSSFLFLNRNKKSMKLNLQKEKGKNIFKELVKISDVVIENFSPGTMCELGLDYEVLTKINPKLIFVSVSGFGQYGPYSHRPSYDAVAQAYSGLMSLVGDQAKEGGPPLLVPDYIGDAVPALYATIGVLAALFYRERTKHGQWVDVAQLDSMVSILQSIVSYMLVKQTTPQLRRKFFTGAYGIFKTLDGYVLIASPKGHFLDTLAKIVGVESINANETVAEWAKGQTVDGLVNELVEAGIPVAPVLTVDKTIENPQVKARNMFIEINHPTAGKVKTVVCPIKFSETPVKIELPPPQLGEHSVEILSRLLGFREEEIAELKKENII
jgi:CoA:oxalate CoA-transferase